LDTSRLQLQSLYMLLSRDNLGDVTHKRFDTFKCCVSGLMQQPAAVCV
jgi:hypothetical protein